MLKEKIRESESELSQKQCKWRNKYWDKNGRCGSGFGVYETREKAEICAQKSLKDHKNTKIKNGKANLKCLEGRILNFEYSWHMQIPVLE